MSDAKDILSLISCVLAVYTASALFATGIYFILSKQWKKQNITSRRGRPAGAGREKADKEAA